MPDREKIPHKRLTYLTLINTYQGFGTFTQDCTQILISDCLEYSCHSATSQPLEYSQSKGGHFH